MRDFSKLATQHSATCFLNSLFREFHDFNITEERIIVPFTMTDRILIPLIKKSKVGRHQYQGVFFYEIGRDKKEISFLEVAQLISDLLSKEYSNSEAKSSLFMERLKNSLRNMELSLIHREKEIDDLYSKPLDFVTAEQGLFIGHNFHPYPKMREGFSDEDYRVYSPEMAGKFPLSWYFIKNEILHDQSAENFRQKSWLQDLYLQDHLNPEQVPAGFTPFPVHTWQKQHLLKNADVQKYLTSKEILEASKSDLNWYPTSSLRSVQAPHAEFMLKFSLTLKLTNSIRHLTDVEVIRGLQVFDVFATSKGQTFLQQTPEFKIIFEPAFAAIKDSAGKIISESIVVCRENPFKDTVPLSNGVVLSTLAQDNPLGGENLIQTHIRNYALAMNISLAESSLLWFKEYLRVAVKPLMTAQAFFGVLLGAHQQNMLLDVSQHLPTKAYFRDCQGTGYSLLGFEYYRQEVKSLRESNGNILDEKGNILFGYYLFINSIFNVIAAIAQDNWVSEEILIGELRDFVRTFAEQDLPDRSFTEYIIDSFRIHHKGNFRCSLQDLNENTSANPLEIYNLVENPLFVPPEMSLI